VLGKLLTPTNFARRDGAALLVGVAWVFSTEFLLDFCF
jgi:hypothetical protein